MVSTPIAIAAGAVHGYTVAFTWSLGVLLFATILSLVLITKQRGPTPVATETVDGTRETVFEHTEGTAAIL